MRITAIAILVTTLASAGAAQADYPVVSQNYAETNLACYMHTAEGSSLDLEAVCGFGGGLINSVGTGSFASNTEGDALPDGSGYYDNSAFVDGVAGSGLYDPNGFIAQYGSFDSMSNLASGPCDYPWQTDSIGRSCGGRAASVRDGGRFSDSDSSSDSGGSNCTYVDGYYRNGSYVSGYRRCN